MDIKEARAKIDASKQIVDTEEFKKLDKDIRGKIYHAFSTGWNEAMKYFSSRKDV